MPDRSELWLPGDPEEGSPADGEVKPRVSILPARELEMQREHLGFNRLPRGISGLLRVEARNHDVDFGYFTLDRDFECEYMVMEFQVSFKGLVTQIGMSIL